MEEIDRQLRASDSFVVFLSEDSILSDMVRQEVQTAHELRTLAFKPDGKQFFVATEHWLNTYSWDGRKLCLEAASWFRGGSDGAQRFR